MASQAGRFPPSQRQCYFPGSQHTPQEGLVASQACAHLHSREGGSLVASQACSLPKDSTASQAGSTHSWEGSSLATSQAGSQATGRTVPPNISTREGPSHAGNNPPTQAGSNVGRHVGTLLGPGPRRLPRGAVPLPQQVALVPGKAPNPLPPNRLPQGSSLEDPNPKWVIKLSSKPLTPAQMSILAKGPSFAVSPKHPPNLKYITAIKAVCPKLKSIESFPPPNPI